LPVEDCHHPEFRVAEIAASLGYNDVDGFRRIFRQVMGLTPSEYRNRFSRTATPNPG
jgi:AraC-like DNA-binding protein